MTVARRLTKMNSYSRPALRSVIVLAILAGMYVASFWLDSTTSNGIPYVHHIGYVRTHGQKDRANDYYVMTVQRRDRPPWLIVAKPLIGDTKGFETSMASESTSVTVDGIEYREIPNQSIVVLGSGDNMQIQHLSSTGNPVIESLTRSMDEVTTSDFDSLFSAPQSEGPSRAP